MHFVFRLKHYFSFFVYLPSSGISSPVSTPNTTGSILCSILFPFLPYSSPSCHNYTVCGSLALTSTDSTGRGCSFQRASEEPCGLSVIWIQQESTSLMSYGKQEQWVLQAYSRDILGLTETRKKWIMMWKSQFSQRNRYQEERKMFVWCYFVFSDTPPNLFT